MTAATLRSLMETVSGTKPMLTAGVAVLDAGREVLRILEPAQRHVRQLAVRRDVVGELAVQPHEMVADRARYLGRRGVGMARRALHGDAQPAVAVGVLHGLEHELPGHLVADAGL